MPRCTDCGHLNRPGVHFCTHCGKPTTVPGTTPSGPTSIVAVVVLAIGLLAFLTIRPVTSIQPAPEVAAAPPVPRDGTDGDARGAGLDDAPALATLAREAAHEPHSPTADTRVPEPAMPGAAVPEAHESATPGTPEAPETPAPEPETNVSAVPGTPAPDAETNVQTVADVALPAPPALPAEASPSNGSSSGPPAIATALGGSDASLGAEAIGQQWMTPAQSPSAPSLALRQAPRLSDAEPKREHSGRPNANEPSHPSAPPASSTVRRAALDPSPARRATTRHSQGEGSWLRRLRVELDACEGNVIVRTICEETAKLRHCTSANAWGEVPECPAAKLPDLATFN